MAEHTGGPWEWKEVSDDYFDGCVVFPQGTPYGDGVAEVWQGHEGWKANARLIAAAPEMLEALYMIRHEFQQLVAEPGAFHAFTRLEAAIAKAKGEA